VIEDIFERRIREKLNIDNMQFGLRPGRELLMQHSLSGRCSRNMEISERSFTLPL